MTLRAGKYVYVWINLKVMCLNSFSFVLWQQKTSFERKIKKHAKTKKIK